MTGLLDLSHTLRRLEQIPRNVSSRIEANREAALVAFPDAFASVHEFFAAVVNAIHDLMEPAGWRNLPSHQKADDAQIIRRIRERYASWQTAMRVCVCSLEGGKRDFWRTIETAVAAECTQSAFDAERVSLRGAMTRANNTAALIRAYLAEYGDLLPPDIVQDMPSWSAEEFMRYLQKHARFISRHGN
jgi:hypothetical protein